MISFDTCSLKKSLPILTALLIVAQIDLVSSAGWPGALLYILHLTSEPDAMCRGVCAGIGISMDVLVVFQFARILAKRALQAGRDSQQD
jgi:hypothetical protein